MNGVIPNDTMSLLHESKDLPWSSFSTYEKCLNSTLVKIMENDQYYHEENPMFRQDDAPPLCITRTAVTGWNALIDFMERSNSNHLCHPEFLDLRTPSLMNANE